MNFDFCYDNINLHMKDNILSLKQYRETPPVMKNETSIFSRNKFVLTRFRIESVERLFSSQWSSEGPMV